MYSYDRRKVARRNVGDWIGTVEDSLKAAQTASKVVNQYLQEAGELFKFLQVNNDLDDAKQYLNIVTKLGKELPAILRDIDRLDDAVDAYTRKVRRDLSRDEREDFDTTKLDKATLKDFKKRAEDLTKKLSEISDLAEEAPASLELEDPYDSPRVGAINKLASQLESLATDITFDKSDLESFLENIEDSLVEAVQRGPQ